MQIRVRHLALPASLVLATVVAGLGLAEVPPRWDGEPDDLNENWQLISGIPESARESVRESERALGSGLWADRAWAEVTKGRREVRIAVLDSGIKWDEPDLIYTVFLNPGELSGDKAPRVDRATPVTGAVWFPGMNSDCTTWPGVDPAAAFPASHDANGDGVFNLADYLCDARLDPMLGVPAADHLIDPSDLIALFSDGVDDDGNGYVDDIAGWDTMWNDNNPYDDTRYGHGTGQAKDAAAEGNNSIGGIGVCPGCTHIPVRVGDSFITDINSFADGVLYALAVSANVIQEALGTLNMNARAQAAIDLAYERGAVMIGSAADETSYHHNWPGSAERSLYTHAVVYDNPNGVAGSTTFLNFSNCTNYGIRLDLSAPATGCSSGATGNTSGLAGIVYSAGVEVGLQPPLNAEEVAQLIKLTTDDIAYADSPTNFTRYPTRAGWDLYTGYGRVNAWRAALAVAEGRIPPEAEIREPRWFDVLDPAQLRAFELQIRTAARRSSGLRWELWVAGGGDVADSDYRKIREGTAGARDRTETLRIPWRDLPVAPVAGLNDTVWSHALSLRLQVYDAEGRRGEARKVVFVRSDPSTLRGWPRKLDGSLETSPKLADLDGDGRLEIIQASSAGRLHVFDHMGRERAGFPAALPARHHGPKPDPLGDVDRASLIGTPAVGDLRGDGMLEVVVADLEGFISVFDHRGQMLPGWPVEIRRDLGPTTTPDRRLEDGWFASPVLADMDGNGQLWVVAAGMDGALHVFDRNGQARPGFPVPISDPDGGRLERIVSTPAVGDLTGDGRAEIVVGSNEFFTEEGAPLSNVRLYAVHNVGTQAPGGPFLRGWPVRIAAALPNVLPYIGRGYPGSVVLADWDGEPGLEILTAPLSGPPEILRADGSTLRRLRLGPWGRDAASSDWPGLIPIIHPSAADLNGDGVPDPVIPLTGRSYFMGAALADGQAFPPEHLMGAWSGRSGEMLPGMPQRIEDWQFFGNPAIVDLDGDGLPEVVSGSGGYLVHAWDMFGRSPRGFPKSTKGWVIATPAFGDLTGDGRLEMVVGTREGWLWVWQTDAPARDRQGRNAMHWPEYHRTGHNNANLSLPVRNQPGPPPRAGGCAAGGQGAPLWPLLLLMATLWFRRHVPAERRPGRR